MGWQMREAVVWVALIRCGSNIGAVAGQLPHSVVDEVLELFTSGGHLVLLISSIG